MCSMNLLCFLVVFPVTIPSSRVCSSARISVFIVCPFVVLLV